MAEQKWYRRGAEGIVIGILTTGACSLIAYLNHIASPWFYPLFYGTVAGGVVFMASLAFLLVRRTPRRRVIPSSKNIESCVRQWLDIHHVSVKHDPKDDLLFRFRITIDSGQQMTIVRSAKDYPDYIQIISDLGIRGEHAKLLDQFTQDEKFQIMFDLKLELARAKIGYGGLEMPPNNFHLIRRVPIFPGLTDFMLMSAIGDIEAATNLVYLMFLKAKQQAEIREGRADSITVPSNSDTPMLDVPTA